MNKFINDVLIKISIVAIPFTLITFGVADIIIAILFQRGEFTALDTTRVSSVFLFYLPATFFMAGGLVMGRAFYAIKKTITPLVISTLSLICVLPFFFLLDEKIGVKGIAASSSIMVFITFMILMVVWERVSKGKFIVSFFMTFAKITIFSVPGMLLTMWLREYAESLNLSLNLLVQNLFVLIFSTIPSLIVTALLFQITGIFDSKALVLLLQKKANKLLGSKN